MDAKPQREWLIPAVFCVAGLLVSHHEMLLHGFAFTQNDLGDTRLVNELLEHVWRWMTFDKNHADIWTLPHFYPVTDTLVWAEPLISAEPFYAPWRMFMEADSAFQMFGLTCGVLNFVSGYYFLRRCFRYSVLGSSIGAALFAFSAIRINLTMHWQFFPQVYSVWALHALFRLVEGPLSPPLRTRWMAVFFACFSLQWWACIYLGWFLLFVGTVALLVLLTQKTPRATIVTLLREQPFTVALGAALCVISMVPMAWRYLEVEKMFGGRPFDEVLSMLPPPRVWVHHGAAHWLYGWTAKLPFFAAIPMEHEQRNGMGFGVLIAAGLGFWFNREKPVVRYVGALLAILVVLTTLYFSDFAHGDRGFAPWKAIWSYFPAAKAIRGVARIGTLYALAIGVFVAAFTDWLIAKYQRRGLVGGMVLGAFFLVEQGQTTPAFDKAANRRDVAAVVAAIGPECDAFLFSPVGAVGPYWKYQLDAAWAATERGIPTINGYSGQIPPGWNLNETRINSAFDEQRVQQAAAQWVQANPSMQSKKICWTKVSLQEGPRAADFVSQNVPAVVQVGATVEVEIVLKNSGQMAWSRGQLFRLGAQSPQDSTIWGPHRIELPGDVPVGSNATIRFQITAPQLPGKYPFQWRMVQDGVAWFGAPTPLVEIEAR